MSVFRSPEGDGGQGGGGGDAGTKPEGQSTAEGQQTPPEEKLFTQSDVDRIAADRAKRAVPKDYDDLKAKAEKFDQAEAAKKDEATRRAEDQARKDQETAAREAKANAKIRRAAVMEEAAKQNAINPSIVARLLESDDTITVDDDGEAAGAEAAVKKLLKEAPELVKNTSARGEFGGGDGKPIADRIRELEAKGDRQSMAEARRLKVEGAAGAM